MADDSIQVTLDDPKLVEFVRAKVRSGEYASEADVVKEMVADRHDDEVELEKWLREVAAERSDAYHADPDAAFTVNELQARLAERRSRRIARAS